MAGTPLPGAAPRPRLLIVNGDDLGLTTGINAGIERACREGVLRSASAMGVGPALADAAVRVRRLPELGVGLHLTLVGAPPACRPEDVPSLIGGDGLLLPDYRAFLRRYLRGGIHADDIRREFRAQAAAVARLGAPLDHLDSHQHLHLLPGLLARALEAAGEHGIRWVRAPRPLGNPVGKVTGRICESAKGAKRGAGPRESAIRVWRESAKGANETKSGREKGAAPRRISTAPFAFSQFPPRAFGAAGRADPENRALGERLMFQMASRWARWRVARAGLPLLDGSLGFDCSGHLTAEYILRHIPALPEGITELICHPGSGDAETRERYSAWGYQWEQELAALTDPAVRRALEQARVGLAGFGEV